MALQSLPGNDFWERINLMVTDPKLRYRSGAEVTATHASHSFENPVHECSLMLRWAHFLFSMMPRCRLVGSQPYLEAVRFRVIVAFTILQLCCLGAVYGVTWAGVSISKKC